MKIEYYGHSCFKVIDQQYGIVIDPYQNQSVPGLSLPKSLIAQEVICSHQHADHNGSELVTIEQRSINPFSIQSITVPHDDKDGSLRGMNNITILESSGIKVAHFGDLGRILTTEEAKQCLNLDCALIPVGGYYTIDVKQALEVIKLIKPRITIVMHYRNQADGLGEIASLQEVQTAIPSLKILDNSSIIIEEVADGIYALKALQ